MPASEQRVRDLWDIADRVRPFFPDGTGFRIDTDQGLNIQADWPLLDQPETLTQRSRLVRLRFSNKSLDFYETAGSEHKDTMCALLGDAITRRMADGYDDGHETPYGAPKQPFDIDAADFIG